MNHNIPRIKPLSAATSALIAAGEIIHGPKDVLKELLENALDAGAKKINIELLQGGIEKIVIKDDGCGILQEDLKYAPQRYTTSKLQNVDDLKSIGTYGFRGEALFSISSVSNFTLKSRPRGQEYGYQIKLWGPERQWEEQKCAIEYGTQIICEHLFAPLPVRRQFLKSPRLESRRCVQTVINIMLMHPECQIYCSDQRLTQINWPATDCLMDRFEKAFLNSKSDWKSFEHACDKGTIKIWYYPQHTKGLEQYWYCHKRWFCDKNLTKLAQQYFEEGIVVIDLELHKELVDVNYHPQKHELDFIRKEGLISSLVDLFEMISPPKREKQVPQTQTMQNHTPVARPPLEQILTQNNAGVRPHQSVKQPSRELNLRDITSQNQRPPQNHITIRPADKNPQTTTASFKNKTIHSSWLFFSKEKGLFQAQEAVILVDVLTLAKLHLQNERQLDLLLPIKLPNQLCDLLSYWGIKIEQGQLQSLPASWDRFWIVAMITDFKDEGRWYRRFYRDLNEALWSKITEFDLINYQETHKNIIINMMSYEEYSERF